MTRVKILYNIGTRIYDELIKCQVVRCSKTRSLGVSTKVNAMATVLATAEIRTTWLQRCKMQTTVGILRQGARLHEFMKCALARKVAKVFVS